ncbi:MAG TPA: TetR/AcrR family transcriptional regulator [Longimicrobium sp.]|nr:TetR/AcrR family transcriptional regulator [Longimicrobium sp.]
MTGKDGNTEARILDAAHAVFTRVGTAGARMQEIADEAGVNKALLHYYFRSKDQLSAAVFRRAAGEFFPRIFAILTSDLPLEEKVRAVVERDLEFLSRHPYLPAYIISEVHHRPDLMAGLMKEIRAPSLSALQAQLDQGAREGRLRPIRAEQAVINLISMIVYPFVAGPLIGAILNLDPDAQRALMDERRTLIPEFFLNALRP